MPKKNDATGKPITFEYDGETYEAPPAENWDLSVLEAIDDGKLTHAVKALLGAEQYATFRGRHSKVTDLNGLFESMTAAVGSGNS